VLTTGVAGGAELFLLFFYQVGRSEIDLTARFEPRRTKGFCWMQIFNPRMSKRKVETTSSIKALKSVDDSSLHAETEANNFLETAQKAIDFAFSPIVVLPGDDVTSHITKTTKKLLLGIQEVVVSCHND
jgi:hypothetical protein